MMESVSELLMNSLKELIKDDLKEFQWHLTNHGIAATKLKNANVLLTVRKMMQHYKPEDAVKNTLDILKMMNQNQLAEELENKHKEGVAAVDRDYTEFSNRLKNILKQKYEQILDGNSQNCYLTDIYTDLYIVKNQTGGVLNGHEMESKRTAAEDMPVKCNDIFKEQGDTGRQNRKVLTMGIAGVGKTVTVNQFIYDWAQEKENQEIRFVFPVPFRQLNLIRENSSLMELINRSFSFEKQLSSLPEEAGKVMFILDGLDECRFPLSFGKSDGLTDFHEKTTVGVMVTNLIERNLLPSALIWITSRPAAADLIPRDYIDQVTEIRGFNDVQKEKYFTRNSSHDVSEKIISHIRKSRSLCVMCHIPIFCWISLSALQLLLTQENHDKIPTTPTGMYIYFLVSRIHPMTEKNNDGLPNSFEDVVLKLGKLAFKQLQKGNHIFHEEDLKKCGWDEGLVFCGLRTQVFQAEKSFSGRIAYSFVHHSVQEFLAALYVIFMYKNKKNNSFLLTLEDKLKWNFMKQSLFELHMSAVDRALQSKNGHLDLFLRFLMGLSLESSHNDMKELLPTLKITAEDITLTADYIKLKIATEESSEKRINLFHCLNELKDDSLIREIQKYLNSEDLSAHSLSSVQWSALEFVLLLSEETQDMFEMWKYRRSDEALIRFLPLIKHTRRALLQNCNLTDQCCKSLSSCLQSSNSLRELDLSNNDLQDSGVKLISDAFKSHNCQLHTLRLSRCNLTGQCCESLSSYLQMSTSNCLRELDLSSNDLQDSGVKLISDAFKSHNCQLHTLRLSMCNLTGECCESLSSCLQSSNSLRELDLSTNDLQDSGVKLISDAFKSHNCQLHILRLSRCNLTSECCKSLSSCLQSSNCLRELDLSNNDLQNLGVKLISDALKSHNCQLHTLRLTMCNLTSECCRSLSSCLQSSNSLRELDLSTNDLQDSGVKLISDALKCHSCQLHTLRLSGCMVTDKGCCYLASSLGLNPSHMRELDLNYNHPEQSGVQLLSDILNDSYYTLNKLNLEHGGEFRITAGLHKWACDLTLDPNTAHTELMLSEKNRKISFAREPQSYPDHPDRFDAVPQVLCRESLTGRCYWETEWSGSEVYISVSYKSISRKTLLHDSWFRYNVKSWSLCCSDDGFIAYHNRNKTVVSVSSRGSNRVGVYMDWSASTLSFYSVSDTHILTHLHTFNTTFTEPLCAGFHVDRNSSVSL